MAPSAIERIWWTLITGVRIFKTWVFGRFAAQEGITDRDLCGGIARAEKGLIDANLGGNVIEQRIGRENQGRSGGFRTSFFSRSTSERSSYSASQRIKGPTSVLTT